MQGISSIGIGATPGAAFGVLKRSRIFLGVDDSELRELAGHVTFVTVAKGEYILRQGYAVDRYYIIEKGTVKVIRHADCGREFILGVFHSGATIGDWSLWTDDPSPISAQAASKTVVLALPKREFSLFISRNPAVAVEMCKNITGRLVKTIAFFAILATEDAESRIVRTLIKLCSEYGSMIPLSHRELGELAAVSRETASRVLENLGRSNVVCCLYNSIVILDKDWLRLHVRHSQ